ncbi:hypothetical protein D9M68_791100 [compost metagenome]
MAQVTCVAPPCGCSVNSAVLWPSKGFTKSSLIATFDAGCDSVISIVPAPALLLPSQA